MTFCLARGAACTAGLQYDALDSSVFKFVIASDSEAIQLFLQHLDCFVAYAPRDDELIRCSCASIAAAAPAGSTHSNCGS